MYIPPHAFLHLVIFPIFQMRVSDSTAFLWLSLCDRPFCIQSQYVAQARPFHFPVCGIRVQLGKLAQAPMHSGYKSRTSLSMRGDLSAQQLAQKQWIPPSALCISERWKLFPCLRVIALHLCIAWYLLAAEALRRKKTLQTHRTLQRISKSREYHTFAQHGRCSDCLFTPPAKQLFRSKHIHTL